MLGSARTPGPAQRRPPLRIVTAVPLCDGHDSAVLTINAELARAGMEVIYLGYHRDVQTIARASVQEDARAVGISSYNGGHVEFFAAVRQALDARGGAGIGLFGGGGGTITRAEAERMAHQGTDRIFFAGEPLAEIVAWIDTTYRPQETRGLRPAEVGTSGGAGDQDAWLAREITAMEARPSVPRLTEPDARPLARSPAPSVVGVTGPGGAGKSTLIDELVGRCLARWPEERVAVLANDPSAEGVAGEGALLGDRATMISCQEDRVFMRSLATRGAGGGLSAVAAEAVRLLRGRAFRWIFVETVGTGQDAVPFPEGMVDRSLLVMTPEYGGRLQLRKIAMLRHADVVVLNKADRPAAHTARAELEERVAEIGSPRPVIAAVARRHRDAGVDALFAALQEGEHGAPE
jgi:methylmalonyl-CoA mutase cobalamin-binding domain/chain